MATVFGLAACLAACGSADAPASQVEPIAVGQPARLKDAEITVTSVVERDKVGIQYAMERASDGATLVVISTNTKNVGTKPLGMFDKPSLKLVDPAGVVYSPDLQKTSAYGMEADLNDKIMSDLNPGITTQGADVYEIAKGTFDPATWSLQVVGGNTRLALK